MLFTCKIPCIPVLSRIVTEFSNYLGLSVNNAIGRQHILDEEYFSRVEAINYTINHDDGQSSWDLYDADIIIIGVSRTSKSPTSVYLSCRGYKAANIPFVNIETIPENIYKLTKPLIVGLTINPEKINTNSSKQNVVTWSRFKNRLYRFAKCAKRNFRIKKIIL